MINSPDRRSRNRAGTATRPLLSTECSKRPRNITDLHTIFQSYPHFPPLFPTFRHFFHILPHYIGDFPHCKPFHREENKTCRKRLAWRAFSYMFYFQNLPRGAGALGGDGVSQ